MWSGGWSPYAGRGYQTPRWAGPGYNNGGKARGKGWNYGSPPLALDELMYAQDSVNRFQDMVRDVGRNGRRDRNRGIVIVTETAVGALGPGVMRTPPAALLAPLNVLRRQMLETLVTRRWTVLHAGFS